MAATKIINLDYGAGKPTDKRAIDAMITYMNRLYGNPSSLHSMGQEAKNALHQARKQVSELINAERPETIIFTSSATESNNLAIKGTVNRNKDRGTKIVTSSVEHMSVVNPIKYLTTKD
jgi:cysteine desulfurase